MGKKYDSSSGKPDLHAAVCGQCGKDCKVPFKPTGNKPVLCSDCFEKSGGKSKNQKSRGRRDSGGGGYRREQPSRGLTTEQYETLDRKLDEILKALSNVVPRKSSTESGKDTTYEMKEKKKVRVKDEKVSLK